MPGRYTASDFSPSLTFSVGAGWSLQAESDAELDLTFDDGISIALVNASAPGAGVPSEPFIDCCERFEPLGHEPFPADYEAWLRSIPELDVGPAQDAALGTATGIALDVSLDRAPGGTCSGTADRKCFQAVRLPSDKFLLFEDRVRIHIAQVGGSTILAFVEGAAHDEVVALLASLQW